MNHHFVRDPSPEVTMEYIARSDYIGSNVLLGFMVMISIIGNIALHTLHEPLLSTVASIVMVFLLYRCVMQSLSARWCWKKLQRNDQNSQNYRSRENY